MRKILLLLIGSASFLAGAAQTTILSVGNTAALTVKSGTIFSADSLVLTPSADLTLSNNNIKISHAALNIAPRPTISRVYYLGSQITFTGTIQLFYQPSELNGNTESILQYTDSATSSTWLPSASSTVNTTSHYVQQTAAARPFIGATASTNQPLALSLISFTGAWLDNGAALQWTISQTQDQASFAIERSTDGTDWTTIGDLAGQIGDGLFTYRFDDASPPPGKLFYRLLISKMSGEESYSNIVELQAPQADQIKLIAANKSVTIYFTGMLPSGIRIVNAAGATVFIDRTGRSQYTLTGMMTGVYFLQYEVNGNLGTRSFLIN